MRTTPSPTRTIPTPSAPREKGKFAAISARPTDNPTMMRTAPITTESIQTRFLLTYLGPSDRPTAHLGIATGIESILRAFSRPRALGHS